MTSSRSCPTSTDIRCVAPRQLHTPSGGGWSCSSGVSAARTAPFSMLLPPDCPRPRPETCRGLLPLKARWNRMSPAEISAATLSFSKHRNLFPPRSRHRNGPLQLKAPRQRRRKGLRRGRPDKKDPGGSEEGPSVEHSWQIPQAADSSEVPGCLRKVLRPPRKRNHVLERQHSRDVPKEREALAPWFEEREANIRTQDRNRDARQSSSGADIDDLRSSGNQRRSDNGLQGVIR